MNLIVNSENRDEIEPKYKTYNIQSQILKDRERWKKPPTENIKETVNTNIILSKLESRHIRV